MFQFNYAENTVEHVIIPLTHSERRELIESPISIHHYGGRSFAGYCTMHFADTGYAHYLRAWRRMQAAGDSATHQNGYLP